MIKSPRTIRALPVAAAAAALVLLCTSGCAVYDEPQPGMRAYGPPPTQGYPYDEPDVVSVYVEPPLSEPAPIAVPWAPPPMLRELPPPMPYPGAVWIGGYWVWQGNWVWATGRWAPPPRPDYAWVQPYYEHRDGAVIFITGHWCPPGVAFVPPPRGQRFNVVRASPGARRGHAPVGPPGVFLPPPPGSRPGLIVPAPVGTSPGVMRGAPPVWGQSNRPEPRQGGAMPSTRPFPEAQEAPAPVPSWRGGSGQPMPAQDQGRDRGAPRDDGGRPPRMRDRNQESPPERPSERMPVEPQRRPFQSAPVQAAPTPAPAPAMQAEPRRRDDRVRMEAPQPQPARTANDSAPQSRRDEGPRRLMGRKGDQDKKDGKGE